MTTGEGVMAQAPGTCACVIIRNIWTCMFEHHTRLPNPRRTVHCTAHAFPIGIRVRGSTIPIVLVSTTTNTATMVLNMNTNINMSARQLHLMYSLEVPWCQDTIINFFFKKKKA